VSSLLLYIKMRIKTENMLRNVFRQFHNTLPHPLKAHSTRNPLEFSTTINKFDAICASKKKQHWTSAFFLHLRACAKWQWLVDLYCRYSTHITVPKKQNTDHHDTIWTQIAQKTKQRRCQNVVVQHLAWEKWKTQWNLQKVANMMKFSTGVYCYQIPEIKVIHAVKTCGESLLANEYIVVKLGKTCPSHGGFEQRLNCEMSEISRWRHSTGKKMSERLLFLLSESQTFSSEKKLLSCVGARIGLAPVHLDKTRPAIEAAIKQEPARTIDDLLIKHKRRLSVKHAWRIWLSGRAQRTQMGPSELLVIPKTLASSLHQNFLMNPGVFQSHDVVCLARQHKVPFREITVNFANAENSLGSLVFVLDA